MIKKTQPFLISYFRASAYISNFITGLIIVSECASSGVIFCLYIEYCRKFPSHRRRVTFKVYITGLNTSPQFQESYCYFVQLQHEDHFPYHLSCDDSSTSTITGHSWQKASFLSILENTVKSTLEKQLLTELEKNINWKNSPKFYEEALQLIKENEGQILGGIMRMVIDKSNGTGKLSIKTVEEVVSDFLNSRTHHKRDEDDHMPNYLNIKFGGFGK